MSTQDHARDHEVHRGRRASAYALIRDEIRRHLHKLSSILTNTGLDDQWLYVYYDGMPGQYIGSIRIDPTGLVHVRYRNAFISGSGLPGNELTATYTHSQYVIGDPEFIDKILQLTSNWVDMIEETR